MDELMDTGELRELIQRVEKLEEIVDKLPSKADIDAHFVNLVTRINELERRTGEHESKHEAQMSEIRRDITATVERIPAIVNGAIERMMAGYTVTVNRMDADINALQGAVSSNHTTLAVMAQRFDDFVTRFEMISAAQAKTDHKLSETLDLLSTVVETHAKWIDDRVKWERRMVNILTSIRHVPAWLKFALLVLLGAIISAIEMFLGK